MLFYWFLEVCKTLKLLLKHFCGYFITVQNVSFGVYKAQKSVKICYYLC